MYITDINGHAIEVADLPKAIRQVQCFMEYSHEDCGFTELDDELCAYWTDMHEKLLQLKT